MKNIYRILFTILSWIFSWKGVMNTLAVTWLVIIIIFGRNILSAYVLGKSTDLKDEQKQQLEKIRTNPAIPELEKAQFEIMKETLDKQHEDVARTIDLLNIVILGVGGVLALFAIVVTLQLNKWDSKDKEINKIINDKTIYFNKIFSRYSRGLSKYYSKNYSAASFELLQLEKEDKLDLSILSDVYFHLGRSYFRKVDTTKLELNAEDDDLLKKSIEYYDEAFKKYSKNNEQEDIPDASQTLASMGIVYAYRMNGPLKSKKRVFRGLAIEKAEESKKLSDEFSKNYRKKEYSFYLPSIYNVACTYSVLHRFETDSELRTKYLKEAMENLEKVYKKNLVRRDYILSDPDWQHMVDPERYSRNEAEQKLLNDARDELVSIIGQFFRKKYSRFEIAKLYLRALQLFNKKEIEIGESITVKVPVMPPELFISKAIERLKRSYDSGLVSKYQVEQSTFKHFNKNHELFKFIQVDGEDIMIDLVNKNRKNSHGEEIDGKYDE